MPERVKVARGGEIALRALVFALLGVVAIFALRAVLPGSAVTLGALVVIVLIFAFLRSLRRG